MNARLFAFQCLKQICLEKKYSNLLLRQVLHKAEEKDKAFITQIVYGTLQNYRYCRYQWAHMAKKAPLDEIAILLDMSVYQLLLMDHVPAYAIINEAVNIAKRTSHNYGKLVNAILHHVQQQGKKEPIGNDVQQLGICTSHPDWLISMWKAQYGWDTTEMICHSDMLVKPQCVRVNTLKTTKEELLQDPCFVPAQIAQDALLYQGRQLASSSYYLDGLVSMQDESSQLVAECVGALPCERILDVCSAPGTKSCHMAQRMENKGEIICGDIHAHRMELIQKGAQRLGISIIKPCVMDATKLSELQEASFDRVLCDVPCSGYGVLGSKADIRYHMQSEDMDTLIPLQYAILSRSSQMVKKAGILVYSTCTLNKKENEKQIEKFLKEHNDYTLVSQQTIFPFTYDSDGFFMARLQRASE